MSISLNTDSQTTQAWVVCLCADWCGLCRDYADIFETAALRFPGLRFVWLDIEDQADLAGDFDIETFPTLLLASGNDTLFFGPLIPHADTLTRLLQSLNHGDLKGRPHDVEVADLLAALTLRPSENP